MHEPIKLLDHGYLQLVESWGSEERIIEAARMSTGKGFLGWVRLIRCTVCGKEWECENKPAACNHGNCQNSPTAEVHPGDHKLLRYLWTKGHSTPFEVPGMTVEVGCPVVVVWQWVRHRTMTYNILSGRYAEMPKENYIPEVGRLLAADKDNRQAGAAKDAAVLTAEAAEQFRYRLQGQYANDEAFYQWALRAGVPKELARLCLGFGRYTRMRVSTDLWNWLRFLKLRTAPDAQHEIRQYADAAGTIVAERFPRTWALFSEKR